MLYRAGSDRHYKNTTFVKLPRLKSRLKNQPDKFINFLSEHQQLHHQHLEPSAVERTGSRQPDAECGRASRGVKNRRQNNRISHNHRNAVRRAAVVAASACAVNCAASRCFLGVCWGISRLHFRVGFRANCCPQILSNDRLTL